MKLFMRILRGILIGLGISVVVFALWVIFSPEEEPVVENTKLGKMFENEFIEGCMEEDASYAYCSCAYDYLDMRTTDKELLDLSVDYIETEEIPDMLLDAAIECYEVE